MTAIASHPVRLLVSVRSAAEAVAALRGGADVIDVKEPSRGPMGRADIEEISEVGAAVAGRAPVSVALGELIDGPDTAEIPWGVSYAKIGLAGAPYNWRERLVGLFARAPHVQPIVVAYFNPSSRAFPPSPPEIVSWAIRTRAVRGVLFDTYMKDRGGLFEPRLSPQYAAAPTPLQSIQALVPQLRDAGLLVGLAGSLSGSSFELAVSLVPDLVGVRGAACAKQRRRGAIDAARVRRLAEVIAAHNALAGRSAG